MPCGVILIASYEWLEICVIFAYDIYGVIAPKSVAWVENINKKRADFTHPLTPSAREGENVSLSSAMEGENVRLSSAMEGELEKSPSPCGRGWGGVYLLDSAQSAESTIEVMAVWL